MEPTASALGRWTLSRRQLLQSIALAGLAAGCSTTSRRFSGSGGVDPEPDLRRRIERASFGVTPALWNEVSSRGLDAWIRDQLAAPVVRRDGAFAELDRAITSLEPETITARPSKEEKVALRRASLGAVTARTVLGAAYAPDQLRQRMVDVLADRLHVSASGGPELYFLPSYDRMLRENAFGRFADLLVEAARHPAMLLYLDNASSRADRAHRPNENFARELMELHTVGVDAGYDEDDVAEVAHVFSGWSIDRRTGAFSYKPQWHSLGAADRRADVLGWSPKGRGEQDGRDFLEHLARHPATAQRMVHLLARRFVGEDIAVDHPLVSEAVAVYDENDTRLGPVVALLLTSDHFGEAATLMLRRPIDMVASTLRKAAPAPSAADLGATVEDLFGVLNVLGQVPYFWPAPDGYPTAGSAWSNAGAVISRWNTQLTLAAGGVRGVSLSAGALGASGDGDLLLALCGPDLQLV